ncbi:MAG TPA: hypothetical protein PKE29_10290 [Phycisphaerales bacterium]|nr:hypothetical protein [Phycisphaerales bacterium]
MKAHMPRLGRLILLVALAWIMPGRSLAQAPAEEPALGGPKVQDRVATSLVRVDAQGRFVKLTVRPEEAALDLILIDPDRRAKARHAIEDRAAAFRRHLVDSIDLIKASTDAIRSGDRATANRLSQDLYDGFDPEHQRDPLAGPIGTVLSAEERAQMTRLVDEYWTAWIDAELKAAGGKGGPTREEMQARLSLGQFQAEVAVAYEYTLRPFQQKIEAIALVVEPTVEQRAAIRDAIIDYIRDGRLKPTDEQRLTLARAIYDVLDEEQRIRLLAAAVSRLN